MISRTYLLRLSVSNLFINNAFPLQKRKKSVLMSDFVADEGAPSHSSHHHEDEEEHSIGDGSLEVRDEGPEVTEEHAAQAGEEHSANNNNNDDSEGGKSKEGKQISIKSSRPLDPRIDSSLDNYAAQQQSNVESNTNKSAETKDKV